MDSAVLLSSTGRSRPLVRNLFVDRNGENIDLVGRNAGSERLAPELVPPVLVVTTEIEASKQRAAWAAVDKHVLPHHSVSFPFPSLLLGMNSNLKCRLSELALARPFYQKVTMRLSAR